MTVVGHRILGHVNHGNLKIYCGVGVSAIFLAVMRCLMIFLAVLRYSQPSNAPLLVVMSSLHFREGRARGARRSKGNTEGVGEGRISARRKKTTASQK